MDKILAAAQTIATARRNRTPLASLPPDLVPGDEAAGYQIQRAVHDLLLPQTGALVGYKIGCTSAVMQQYLDIPHPCAGGVFAKGVHDSGAKLQFGDYVRVGVECEIAVRLARSLSPGEGPFTAEWMMEAIEAYHPAIEIVDDRYVKWETMGAPTLVADDFFAAGCVLGKAVPRTKAPDLLTVNGRALINGKEAGQRHRRRRARPSPQRAGLARQPSRRRRQGTACRADRADGEPREDGVARSRRQREDGTGWVGDGRSDSSNEL